MWKNKRMQVLREKLKPLWLEVTEVDGDLRIAKRPERRRDDWLALGFVSGMPLFAAWSHYSDTQSEEPWWAGVWALVGLTVLGSAFYNAWRIRKGDVWVVSHTRGAIEHNGDLMASLGGLRSVVLHDGSDEDGFRCVLLLATRGIDGRDFDLEIDRCSGVPSDWAEYVRVGQAVARYAQVPFEER